MPEVGSSWIIVWGGLRWLWRWRCVFSSRQIVCMEREGWDKSVPGPMQCNDQVRCLSFHPRITLPIYTLLTSKFLKLFNLFSNIPPIHPLHPSKKPQMLLNRQTPKKYIKLKTNPNFIVANKSKLNIISKSSKIALSWSADKRPVKIEIKVVLPTPLWPRLEWIWLVEKVSEKLWRAVFLAGKGFEGFC